VGRPAHFFPEGPLSPAFEQARHCIRCGAPTVRHGHASICRSGGCGFRLYFNPKPVAAVIPWRDGRILLHRRATEPRRGAWAFPGGFVDLGESAQEAAIRESREEMALELVLGELVGVYSRPDERNVMFVWRAEATSEAQVTDDSLEVRAFTPDELPWDGLAFWSTEQALRDELAARDGAA
jgi:ADP-ribose pyrophosphatase YjhB (NUDIX family)